MSYDLLGSVYSEKIGDDGDGGGDEAPMIIISLGGSGDARRMPARPPVRPRATLVPA